jgi:hypothetical protein
MCVAKTQLSQNTWQKRLLPDQTGYVSSCLFLSSQDFTEAKPKE